MSHVLVIEDNVNLALGLRHSLESDGYAVTVAHDGQAGIDHARATPAPDLIVLDLMLPGVDGFSVLRQLRTAGLSTPVLILSALGEDVDKVQGFRLGADDYVVKPVGLVELLLRVRAILRRSGGESGAPQPVHELGDVFVDLGARTVTRGGQDVEMTRLEFDLLACLLRNRGKVVTREALLSDVWGFPEPSRIRTRTLDTHVATLRSKLGRRPGDPGWIVTVRKVGYRLGS